MSWVHEKSQGCMRTVLENQAAHMKTLAGKLGLARNVGKHSITVGIHTYKLRMIAKAVSCLQNPAIKMPEDHAERQRLTKYFMECIIGLPQANAAGIAATAEGKGLKPSSIKYRSGQANTEMCLVVTSTLTQEGKFGRVRKFRRL